MHRHLRLAIAALLGTLMAAVGCGGGGGGGGGHGGRGGTAGGLTGVGGLGLVDGGGPTDGGGSSGADVRLDPAPPICGNGVVETGEACDGAAAAGCPTGQVCGPACACVAGPTPPGDSGALIAAALAAGRIDYFTSLLYRAYRLAGDGRLPSEFDGDLTVGEDSPLFLEVSRLWASLTPAQQQQLTPYVARPTDPASVYATPPVAALFGDSGDELYAPGDSDPIQCPVNAQTGLPDFRFSEAMHFVVWSCAGGDPAADPTLSKRKAAAAIADQVWALETPGMGPPRPDDFPFGPGDKTRIDIYLVPLNKCVRRAGDVCAALTSPRSIAAAVPDSPCDATGGPLTSSGYVLMRLDLTPDAAPAAGAVAKARSDFAHEFFHLLTYGLNLEAQGGACSDKKYTGVGGKTSWLTEASATWAEWAYTPADDPDFREGQFSGYQKRTPSVDSLLDNHVGTDDNPAYQAYPYPLFLSQEAGGRAPFEGFWKGAAGPRTPEALDDYLDSRFAFDPHFRDFAVRVLNKVLPGDPIAPLLSATDDAVPADYPPLSIEALTLPALVTDFPFHVTLAPLAAQYQLFSVPDATRFVDIDLMGAGPDLTLDAVVNVKGTWSRRRSNGRRLTFCRDDGSDDISEFYLVIANTGHTAGAKADTDYKVKTRFACPAVLTGWIRSENLVTGHDQYGGDTTDRYERQSETWTLGAESMYAMGPLSLPAIDAHWSGRYEVHDSTVTVLNGDPCLGGAVLQTQDGTGSGSNLSQLVISDAPGGVIYLSPTGTPPGTFNAPMTFYAETCDGRTSTMTSDHAVNESLALVSTYVMLMPDAANSDRYSGSAVVLHQETPRSGGSDLIDWVVTWDIARNRR